jgi:hypothetical protein
MALAVGLLPTRALSPAETALSFQSVTTSAWANCNAKTKLHIDNKPSLMSLYFLIFFSPLDYSAAGLTDSFIFDFSTVGFELQDLP